MGNRSHRNAGHQGMNALRKRGGTHVSEKGIEGRVPKQTLHAVLTMDCIELLQAIPDNSVQLIVCDPPYNIGRDFGEFSDQREHIHDS